ncbi:HPP family protein [Thermoproteota archaeon]
MHVISKIRWYMWLSFLWLTSTAFAQATVDERPSFYADGLEKISTETMLKFAGITAIILVVNFLLFIKLLFAFKKNRALNSIFLHEAMTTKLVTVGPSETLFDALSDMRKNKIKSLPVTTEMHNLEGVITIKEINNFLTHGKDTVHDESILKNYKVEKFMIKNPPTLHLYDTLNKAVRIMKQIEHKCIPIIDETGSVLGILTQTNIVNAINRYLLDPEKKAIANETNIQKPDTQESDSEETER